MQTKWFARAGVGLFLVIVATVSIVEMRSPPTTVEAAAGAATGSPDVDPLRVELVRCQGIGAAGANDPDCLRAWAENRRRFLSPGARPADPLSDVEAGRGPAAENGRTAVTTPQTGAH
jgi:conjugative transfer region protein TrbK